MSTNAAGSKRKPPGATPAVAWRILTAQVGNTTERAPSFNADIVAIARRYIDLYYARQQADYDHTAVFRKASVVRLIDSAEQIVAVAEQPRRGAKKLRPLYAVAALSSSMLRAR